MAGEERSGHCAMPGDAARGGHGVTRLLAAPDAEEKAQHHGGSHRSYMAYKNAKLQEQFAGAAAAAGCSRLFAGVAIHVNGFTAPSHIELKHLMALHGGRFENYYGGAVTHIICSNLPDAKVLHHGRERDPTPIVRPEWITACIQAGRLLPHHDYVLEQLRGPPGQRTLDAFAAAAAPPPPPLEQPAAAAAAPGPPHEQQPQPAAPPPPPAPPAAPSYDPAALAAAHASAARLRAGCAVLQAPPRASKDDPNFVDSYFRASRLHFIGSWKARLEALMGSAAASQAPAPLPPAPGRPRTVIHVDMDCFFASVAEVAHPEFRGLPLAVSHSNSARGSGEVSSANYEARRRGVGAGMPVARAKELCPPLVIVPYEFDLYEAASEAAYRVFLRHTSAVAAVSCDEAFLDVTGLGDGAAVAAAVRAEVAAATGGCTASAGVGPNMLLARIATRHGKPNGQFVVAQADADAFLGGLGVSELPGVGWSTKRKLEELGMRRVADVAARSRESLQRELGARAGALLWDFARGRDARAVEPPPPRRSVGAEVNWGVRFESEEDPARFLARLAAEVAGRLRQAGLRGRTVTLKVKRSKEGWTEPSKFLGMGACDSLSRSVTLPRFTDCPEEVAREAGALLRALRLPFAAIRGLGLQVTRLDSDAAAAGARPHAAAPARAAAPPATRHDPHAPNPWGGFFAAAAGAAGAAAAPAEAPQAAERASEGASDAGWATDSGAQQQAQQEQQEQASPAPRGGTPQRRTPGKLQVSLRAALRRAAPPSPAGDGAGGGGAAADEEGGGELRAADRRRLLERYEGLTLTQVDAAELAALPWEVQKELVETLPRSRAALAMAAAAAGGTVPPSSPAPLGPPSSAQPAAAGGGGGGGGGGTPIVALPARSQVDPAVLAALPADVRRELEAAYGMAPPRRAGPKRAGGAGAGASGGRSKRREAAAVSKRQRLDSFVANPPPYGGAAARRVVAAPAAITLSQIDPGVLSALPEELRREVLAQVAPPPPPLLRGRSRLGAGAAAAADAASERRRLQEVQDAQLQGSASEGEEEACGGGGEAGGAAELPPAAAAFLEAAHAAAQPATGAALCALLERLHPCLEALEAAEDPPASPQPSPSWAGAGSPASMLPGQPASDVVPATQPIVASANSPAALQRSTSASPSRSAAPATARARQLGAGVAALEAWLAAAARPLVAHDLEGARDVLLRVQDLGARHPCFADAAARAAGRLQRRVRRRYGLPLSTARLLAAGGGSTPA